MTNSVVYYSDYTPCAMQISHIVMRIYLAQQSTRVLSQLHYYFTDDEVRHIALNGEGLDLRALRVNGHAYSDYNYDVTAHMLHINNLPPQGIIETEVIINPKDNTRLEGLYIAGDIYTTQCEAEGFRHITFCLDRPDILSLYNVTIYADKNYTTLLCNGNLQETTIIDDKRMARWDDPFPKPCYLFALVAGDLAVNEATFRRKSGRDVMLRLYSEPAYIEATQCALDALKKAMLWDETRFNLEYDLDIFNIVAIRDFNMGAMENKSLNIFNAKFLIGDTSISTDKELQTIEAIIGHEYFHNYTGNRVTLRDWFQLSLKEGLTVFREQEFMSDSTSRALKRIEDVAFLRLHQFSEDAGGLAHPVRPSQYSEINNFYTMTIYEKGSEIIRMMHSVMGEDAFQVGFADYIKNFDGKAPIIEDFVESLTHHSWYDMHKFMVWYNHPGTPHLRLKLIVHNAYSATLSCQQYNDKAADIIYPIPLLFTFLGHAGVNYCQHINVANSMIRYNSIMVMIDDAVMDIDLHSDVELFDTGHLSLNRNFGAPIYIEYNDDIKRYQHIMLHDDDGFSAYEASYTLMQQAIISYIETHDSTIMEHCADNIGVIMAKQTHDDAMLSTLITIPKYAQIAASVDIIDVDAIINAIDVMRQHIATNYNDLWYDIYHKLRKKAMTDDADHAGARQLLGTCLYYMNTHPDGEDIIARHYYDAPLMTTMMQALQCSLDYPALGEQLLADFLQRYRHHDIVIDKYLMLFSAQKYDNILDKIQHVCQHAPYFRLDQPNKTRALLGGFAAGNPRCFHTQEGYNFYKDFLLRVDAINPQNAARHAAVFKDWYKFKQPQRQMQRNIIQELLEHNLSKDVTDILQRMQQPYSALDNVDTTLCMT